MVVSLFITTLLEKLASDDLIRLARIYSDLEELKHALIQIQAVLVDAAKKSISCSDVQCWLDRVHHLVYDMDDLLDDLATKSKRRQFNHISCANSSTSSKVFNIIRTTFANFTPHNIVYDRKLSSKLDAILTKLRDCVAEVNILGLDYKVERTYRQGKNREETSLVDESTIKLGDGEKEALLKMLLENHPSDQNVSLVSIVGMGGTGKTTLAKVLYNDEIVKDHFEIRVWICVSEFDVFTISRTIFQFVGGDIEPFSNLNLLQVALKEILSNRRFLLVLDDVWNEDHEQWAVLEKPFRVGAPGSKIIVTTRKDTVARVMKASSVYHMNMLSDKDALSLLAQQAIGAENFDSHPSLEPIAEGIVRKCEGLPWAMVAFGRVLRGKTSVEEWKELLTDEVWNSQEKHQLFPAIKLSYDDLPLHLKKIFAYFSLFSQDCVFDKNELILLWVSEGFLNQANGIISMERLGHECFLDLESRSLIQRSTNDNSLYTMHGQIHKLAEAVAGNFFLALDKEMDDRNMSVYLENVRHLSFIRQRFGSYRKFEVLQRARRLRTLLAVSTTLQGRQKSFLSKKVLIELLPRLQFLRVLNLKSYSITEVPQSICSLKHMRYLNFSETDITCLPEQIGGLNNLQSLLLRGCEKLFSLPNSLVNLINLRHLDIRDTPSLNKIPLGIGELSLQTLSKVVIEGVGGFQVSELKDLSDLQGQLSIEGLHNVKNEKQAKESNLQQKKSLDDLEMKWKDDFQDSTRSTVEYQVLEGLKPHDELRNLKILFYGGVEFPSWIGDPSFVQLKELTLRGCRSCLKLPTLGYLRLLRKLFVESMDGVKVVDFELLGSATSPQGIAFQALEVLEFKDMQNWETWSMDRGDNSGTISFPCLREISILNCPKLSRVSIESIPSLGVLHIQRCSKAALRSMVGVSSSIVRLTMENITGLTQLHGEVLEHLGKVKYLCIKHCDELKYLWKSESDACNILVSLWKLDVQYCKRLISLGEKEGNLGISLKSVTHVELQNCAKLVRYNCPNIIEKLVIWDCPLITTITFPIVRDPPSRLNILDIRRCDKLGNRWHPNNFLSSVQYLGMERLPNLRSFPEGSFGHLNRLIIRGCDNLVTIPDNIFDVQLKALEIISCMTLKSIPHEHLARLTSLEELWISNCPSMDSFPCGLWPPNLSNLTIGGLRNPMSKWGPQDFPTSLVTLYLHGENSGVVSFASLFSCPSSISFLEINGFMHLKSLKMGLEHLTCLDELVIDSCPKLGDLPETLLCRLSGLKIYNCLKLQERCLRKNGKYRRIISEIPELYV